MLPQGSNTAVGIETRRDKVLGTTLISGSKCTSRHRTSSIKQDLVTDFNGINTPNNYFNSDVESTFRSIKTGPMLRKRLTNLTQSGETSL